jgi:hypothetical protein
MRETYEIHPKIKQRFSELLLVQKAVPKSTEEHH